MKEKHCQHIDRALELCKLAKNPVKEISEGWSNAQRVFYMSETLALKLKNEIEKNISSLEFYQATTDAHYSPDEGFFCKKCKVGISFPVKK